jgi:hypothetical protein
MVSRPLREDILPSAGSRGTAGPRPVCRLHTKDVGQEDYCMPCLPNSTCLCHLLLPLALISKTLKNPDQFGPKTDIQKEMQTPSKSREKMAAVLEQAVHLRDKALQARKKTDEQRQEDAEVCYVCNTTSVSTSQLGLL